MPRSSSSSPSRHKAEKRIRFDSRLPSCLQRSSRSFGLLSAARAALQIEILALRQTATDWLAVASPLTEQVEADRAANFAERFTALEKQAETARVAAKAPILEAARLIDATWKPVIAEAASGNKSPKDAAAAAQKRAERYYKV